MKTYIINLGNGLYIGDGKPLLNGLQIAFKNVTKRDALKWNKDYALPYLTQIKKTHHAATLELFKPF